MKNTCVLVGDNNLLIECGNYLLSQRYNISCVLSSFPPTIAWSKSLGIKCLSTTQDLNEYLSSNPRVYYLFSVVNTKILPNSILQQIRYFAINYHDSLLPQYAGRHATSWAIINDEKQHGITWHIMNEGVDEGNILEQEVVTIDNADTTLSLNVKCYEAGLKAFKRLISKISMNAANPTAQDMRKRSFFSVHMKPPGDGLLNWHQSATEIERIFRALRFGSYNNRFSTPKVMIGDTYYIVTLLKILNCKSNNPPGTIVHITERQIQITTVTHDVCIEAADVNRNVWNPIKLNCTNAISVGDDISHNDTDFTDLIKEISEQVSKHESFWVKEVLSCTETTLPYFLLDTQPHLQDINDNTNCLFEYHFDAIRNRETNYNLMFGVILTYIKRLSRQSTISTSFSNATLQGLPSAVKTWLSTHIPLTLTLNDEMTFDQVLAMLHEKLDTLNDHFSFTKDICARYQDLKDKDISSLISIEMTDQLSSHSPSNQHNYCFVIESPSGNMRLYSPNSSKLSLSHVNFMRDQIAGHFATMISSLDMNPLQRLGDLAILTPHELDKVTIEWNSTSIMFPSQLGIHQLFENQATINPSHVAVVFEGTSLSYAELNRKADLLANYLLASDVGNNSIVGLCLERSIDLIVSILAVIKSGAAYLPLDPDYPPDRLTSIINDSQLTRLITTSDLMSRLESFDKVIIKLDNGWENHIATMQADTSCAATKNVSVDSNSLAYVLYTSGSTGTPKGVRCKHTGLINRIFWMQLQYSLSPSDKVLHKTPFSFDVSLWEIFWPLSFGATMVVAKPNGHKDVSYLIDTINTNKITTLHFVPSMLDVFLHVDNVSCPYLKHVFCSGEVLRKELVDLFYKTFSASLHNLYGPTEASIDVSFWDCPRNYQDTQIPIGRAIANMNLYILDELLKPLPIGIAGEIYISGIGLADGYLNQPDLTAERFVINPFSGKGNTSRLYRSGDLGYYLPNGEIIYLSRVDSQVKLRGFRIELQEIEAHINNDRNIKTSVALLREDVPGRQQLIAYIVLKDRGVNEEDFTTALKRKLEAKLPYYMIPDGIILVDSIPLTISGKQDLKSLPPYTPNNKLGDCDVDHPYTQLEDYLVTLWKTLLKLSVLSIEDNFFDAGGNSLLATQMLANVRAEFNNDVSLIDLFNCPTIKSFSRAIQDRGTVLSREEITQFKPRPNHIPLSFAQQRLWWLDQMVLKKETYNIPLLLSLTGKLHVKLLEEAFKLVIHRHEILRTNFIAIEGKPAQVTHPNSSFRLEQIHLINLEDLEKLVDEHVGAKFDLAIDCLIRVKLFILNKRYILSIVFPHIVSDESSLNILLKELSSNYTNLLNNTMIKSKPLPLQYVDFALWQKMQAAMNTHTNQAAYWSQQLTNTANSATIPTDKPRARHLQNLGKTYSTSIPPDLAEQIRILSVSHGVTIFMTLMAALKLLLAFYSNNNDIIIGTPINERKRVEFENLIGCFVNVIAVRTRIDLEKSFVHLLSTVKVNSLAGYQQSDIPLQRVVNDLKIKRNLNTTTLYQVMFSVQSEELPLDLPGIGVEILPCFTNTSKLDMTFYILTNRSNEWIINVEYSTELFYDSTIMQIVQDFKALLAKLAANPGKPLNLLHTRHGLDIKMMVNC